MTFYDKLHMVKGLSKGNRKWWVNDWGQQNDDVSILGLNLTK